MNADRLLKLFVPKEHKFVDLFEASAGNLLNAARLLREMMMNSSHGEFELIYNQIRDLEHEGDRITKNTYEQLNKSFITSFDREDIHQLTANIDDVVDLIHSISKRILLYRPNRFIPAFVEITGLILEAAKEIHTGILLLKDPERNKLNIIEACGRIKSWEHKADDIYFTGANELFSLESDTIELIKINKILENLESCINEEEKVANTIKTIVIKIV